VAATKGVTNVSSPCEKLPPPAEIGHEGTAIAAAAKGITNVFLLCEIIPALVKNYSTLKFMLPTVARHHSFPYASYSCHEPPPLENLLLILCAMLMHDLFAIAKFLVWFRLVH